MNKKSIYNTIGASNHTDKEREIHEFEYINGRYIHKYVLGGEHEMASQEIVDCLNAITTIDCDLSTAYAYIEGQEEKIADLQHRLGVAEKALELACKYNIPDDEYSHITLRFSDTGVQVENWQELKEYTLKQAESELKGE